MYQFSVKKSVYASWVSHLLNDRITKVKKSAHKAYIWHARHKVRNVYMH